MKTSFEDLCRSSETSYTKINEILQLQIDIKIQNECGYKHFSKEHVDSFYNMAEISVGAELGV